MLCFFAGMAGYGSNTGGGQNLLTVSVTSGMILVTMIKFGGSITGSHINPILTTTFVLNGDIRVRKGIVYILSQVTGSLLGGLFLWICLPKLDPEPAGYVANPTYPTGPMMAESVTLIQGCIMEFFATFIMFCVIFMCVFTNQSMTAVAVFVAATVIFLINAIGPFTGGSMNPARTLGPFMFSNNFKPYDSKTQPTLVFYVSTFAGGIMGWAICRFVIFAEQVKEEAAKIEAEKKKIKEAAYTKKDLNESELMTFKGEEKIETPALKVSDKVSEQEGTIKTVQLTPQTKISLGNSPFGSLAKHTTNNADQYLENYILPNN